MSFVGKAVLIRFDEPGSVRFSISDHPSPKGLFSGTDLRKPSEEECAGPLNDAVDAFVLSLIEAGELKRVHTKEGEKPFYPRERVAYPTRPDNIDTGGWTPKEEHD